MKVGIRIPGAGPWAGPEAIAEISQFAEKAGFDSLWMTDHVALPTKVDTPYPYTSDGKFLWAPETPYLDCLTSLTWAAAATERVELGTSCLILPWRPLVQTTKTLVSIDVLSRGRLTVAIGVGWMKEQFDILGAPFKDRGRRVTEMINAMRHMWTEDESTSPATSTTCTTSRCIRSRSGAPSPSGSPATARPRCAGSPQSATAGTLLPSGRRTTRATSRR